MTRRGILFVVILLLLGGGAVLASIRVLATERVLYLEAGSAGPDPFTPPAVFTADSPPPPTPIDPTVTITTPPNLGNLGANPGPVGGNAKRGDCDAELLIQHLNENPERLAAWLELQGVLQEEFEDYLRAATPASLTRDIRVTHYGFREGRAVDIQAIFAAGTAVLVDENDEIAIRCYSGSPIKPPEAMDRYRCDGCPADLPTPAACNESCYDVRSETTTTTTSAPSTTAVTTPPQAESTTTTTVRRSTGTQARRRVGRTAVTTTRAAAPPTTRPPAPPATIDPNFFSTQPRTFPSAAPAPPTTVPQQTNPTNPGTAPTIPPTTFPQQTTTQPPAATTQPAAATTQCDLLECLLDP